MLKEYALKNEDIEYVRENMPTFGVTKKISNFYYIFSDPTRILIIAALRVSELCVTDLCEILMLNQTTISHQLKILRDSNIVDYRRYGKILFYKVIDKNALDIINSCFQDFAVVS